MQPLLLGGGWVHLAPFLRCAVGLSVVSIDEKPSSRRFRRRRHRPNPNPRRMHHRSSTAPRYRDPAPRATASSRFPTWPNRSTPCSRRAPVCLLYQLKKSLVPAFFTVIPPLPASLPPSFHNSMKTPKYRTVCWLAISISDLCTLPK